MVFSIRKCVGFYRWNVTVSRKLHETQRQDYVQENPIRLIDIGQISLFPRLRGWVDQNARASVLRGAA
jgi:hypothetical protein